MKNDIPLVILLATMLSSCSSDELAPSHRSKFSDQISIVEEIKIGSSKGEVIKRMGEPAQTGIDEKTGGVVFRYVESRNGEVHSRGHFVFEDPKRGLMLKYLKLYDDDPESSLEFWRARFPSSDFTPKVDEVMLKDAIVDSQYIILNPHEKLEIKNDRVITVFWE